MFDKGGIANPIWTRTLDSGDDDDAPDPQAFWGVQFGLLIFIIGITAVLVLRLPFTLLFLVAGSAGLGALMLPISVTRAVCVFLYVVIAMLCATCIAHS